MPSLEENYSGRVPALLAVRALRLLAEVRAQGRGPKPAAGFRMLSGPAKSWLTQVEGDAIGRSESAAPLHRLFEQHAARHPSEICVVCSPQKITYGEINERANRLGRFLRRTVESPTSLVGIFIEQCPGTLVCLLAALKAGLPYIPLNPEEDCATTAAILAETEALVLLPSGSAPGCLPALRARAVNVESESQIIERGGAGNLPRNAVAEELCSVAFRACALGKGGPGISHRACLNAIEALRDALSLTASDRFVASRQPDVALSAIWMLAALICGVRLVLGARPHEQAGELVFEHVERSRVAVLQATSETALALLDTGYLAHRKVKLVCGAEPWPTELLMRLDAMGAEVWQLSGSPGDYRVYRNYPNRLAQGSAPASEDSAL